MGLESIFIRSLRKLARMSRKAPSSLNQLQHMLVATDDFKNPSDDEVSVAASVLKKWPLFSVDIYRDRHGDLANYTDDQLIEHFARFGIWENRTYSTIPHIARMIAKIDVSRSIEEKLQIRRPTHVPTVTVLVSSCGNAFMSEIAEEIAQQLKSIGGIVRMRDDSADPSAIDGIPIVVAPHEFFILGNGPKWQRSSFVRRAVMLATEQPQTPWFNISVPYILRAKAVIELCYQNAKMLNEAGKPTYFHMPAFCETKAEFDESEIVKTPIVQALSDAAINYDLSQDSFASRPIDIAFFGSDSQFRDNFFARATSNLAKHRQVILYRRSQGSPKPYGSHNKVARINNYTLQRSKILLNIHRDSFGYFEIHRIGLMGFLNKCLVVSDHCIPHPIFKPGVHYLEETIGRIPKLIDWLLTTNEGIELADKMISDAFGAYKHVISMERQSNNLASFLASLKDEAHA